MVDSDGEYIQDASDDEENDLNLHSFRDASNRRHSKRGKKGSAIRIPGTAHVQRPDFSRLRGGAYESLEETPEAKKRRRLRADTKPFQRGIIRHVVLILDFSEAMLERDMPPSRFTYTLRLAQDYVREFFEQNPISQMSVTIMQDGKCKKLSELTGNPNDHILAIHHIRNPRNPRDPPKDPSGSPSLQNALELSRATLYHTPSHGTREVIIVFGSLLSQDPGDIFSTINKCIQDRIQVTIIGMGACVRVCEEICRKTNFDDKNTYTVAVDKFHLRDLLMATTVPPAVRSATTAPETAETSNSASLMMMGFPSRVMEESHSLCACHGKPTRGGYSCSRCKAKICTLPASCPGCGLTLILSTHLARSYHHLFPLRNWIEVSWARAREKGSLQCKGCLTDFEQPPPEILANGHSVAVKQGQQPAPKSWVPGVSESHRYECPVCENHFCVDCDLFCHEVVHNCPGCTSQAEIPAASDTNGDAMVVD